jgi:hypothetical protein
VFDRDSLALDSFAPVVGQVRRRELGDDSVSVVEEGITGDEFDPRVPSDVVESRPGRAADEHVAGENAGVGDDTDEPERRFDAVTRFEERDEPDLGPDLPEPSGDAPPRVQFLFWGLVVVFNLAVLGIGVGLLLIVLGGNFALGGQILLAGLLLLGYGLYRYRGAREEVDRLVDGNG